MGGSAQIQAFMTLRNELTARPLAGVWLPPVRAYLELAQDLADRWSPAWWNPLADDSAFDEQREQARAVAEYLDEAAGQLASASPDFLLAPEWQQETLRHLEAAALIAAAWEVGEDTMDEALARIPADVGGTVRGAVETAGSVLDRYGGVLAGGALVVVVAVGALALSRRLG